MSTAAASPASSAAIDRELTAAAAIAPRSGKPRDFAADDGDGRPAVVGRRWFYGWLMVPLATLVMIASAPGQTYGFIFFNPALRKSLSLSQTELSATYLLATLLAALPLSYLGGLTDRFGLKRSILVAVAGMAASCLLASTVQNATMLFCACLAMRMIGAGVISLLANNTLAAWFDRKLGLACGLMQMAMAASMALVPLGTMALIAQVGWRNAYATMGVSMIVGLLPLLWFAYREHPRDVGQFPDGAMLGVFRGDDESAAWQIEADAAVRSLTLAEAVATPIFWLLMTATGVWSLIGTGLMFHLEAVLAERGLTAGQAAWATPLMAIFMGVMQLGGGLLADRVPIRRLIAAALACIAVGCTILASVHGPGALTAYAVHGMGQGLMAVVSSASWARYFGPQHLGCIRGTAATAAIACSAMGPLAMGASVDALGGFEPSLWVFAAIAAVVALGATKKIVCEWAA